jgi:hypothetical protein
MLYTKDNAPTSPIMNDNRLNNSTNQRLFYLDKIQELKS